LVSLTSDRYDPSGCRSVLMILTFRSGPFDIFSVMTSPGLGGAEEASLPPPWARANPMAAETPNTPAQTHRFQNHRIMADSVQRHPASVRDGGKSRSVAAKYIGFSDFAG